MRGPSLSRRTLALAAATLVVVTALITAAVVAVRSDAAAAPPEPLRIAVVGDYYTVGTQNVQVWPTLLAERTGWAVSNSALPDAGYAADGRGAYAFTYQVDRALASDPDIVLLVGGTSDTAYGPDSIAYGAADSLRKITESGRRALVVGPTWYEEPIPELISMVSDVVGTKADEAGAPFLNALEPPWLSAAEMRSDFTGPNDAGQEVLAEKIEAWLREETGR